MAEGGMMERKNVTLDEATLEAAEYLRAEYGITTTSAAIRYAVQEFAKRSGWKKGRRAARAHQAGGGGEG